MVFCYLARSQFNDLALWRINGVQNQVVFGEPPLSGHNGTVPKHGPALPASLDALAAFTVPLPAPTSGNRGISDSQMSHLTPSFILHPFQHVSTRLSMESDPLLSSRLI